MKRSWKVEGKDSSLDYKNQINEGDVIDIVDHLPKSFITLSVNAGNKFAKLSAINLFPYNDSAPPYSSIPVVWSGTAYLTYATQALASGHKVYFGGGELRDDQNQKHVVLVIFVPIVDSSNKEAFVLILAHLDEDQPVISPTDQGGVIHGPGV